MKRFFKMALFLGVSVLYGQQGGMWIPSLLEGMNAKEMKTLGMKMTVADIYSVNKSSLKDAAPHFNGGCSSEVISDKGLLLTTTAVMDRSKHTLRCRMTTLPMDSGQKVWLRNFLTRT